MGTGGDHAAALAPAPAVQMAAAVTESKLVRTHLKQLINDTLPHQQRPAVRKLREGLQMAVAA